MSGSGHTALPPGDGSKVLVAEAFTADETIGIVETLLEERSPEIA